MAWHERACSAEVGGPLGTASGGMRADLCGHLSGEFSWLAQSQPAPAAVFSPCIVHR